jgi:uncharacterized membrane protein
MQAYATQVAERLRTSLWIVPSICTLVAAVLAFLLIEIDRWTGSRALALPWTFAGGAESARAVLSTIAGSMITVAGTVYSLTIVVLTLASSQFAPRILGTFMRDRTNQVVLGFFVATFTYCLLVLRAVRGGPQDEFVPGVAVTGGLVLTLLSLGMLIYFIDHIFHSIQVSSILAQVAAATEAQIRHLYPTAWQPRVPPPPSPPLPQTAVPVLAPRSGYLQFVDYAALLDLAVRADLVLYQEHSTGAFVAAGTPLLFVSPPEGATPFLQTAVYRAFAVGTRPTMQQDVAFGLRQIVDIALKAISPAVNDPTTALNCLDHLGAILVCLADRQLPAGVGRDAQDHVRLVVHERDFADYVRLAFDQIRHYGASDHVIMVHMLDVIAQVAPVTQNPAVCDALAVYAERIAATAARRLDDPDECAAVRRHTDTTVQRLRGAAQPLSTPVGAEAER